MPKTIILKGDPIILDEDKAAAAITPGHLVDFDSSGDLVVHAGAAKNASPMWAIERDELGDDVDDAYATSDQVKVASFAPGDEVWAYVASGEVLSKGDFVESDGAGRLKGLATDAATDDTQRESVVGRIMVAKTADTSHTRYRVQVV